VLVDGHNERLRGFRSCIVVSSGAIDRFNEIRDSIVIINGDVPRLTSVYQLARHCTGDVGPISTLRSSVVLAVGQFDGSTGAQEQSRSGPKDGSKSLGRSERLRQSRQSARR